MTAPVDRTDQLRALPDLWREIQPWLVLAAENAAADARWFACDLDDYTGPGIEFHMRRKFAAGEAEHGRDWLNMTRDQLREWVKNNTGSYYHFVGSCKMGVDAMAVVDPTLKVRGVDGLRIADGSVIPTIPAANTHTTIVMIGERAAAFLLRDAQ